MRYETIKRLVKLFIVLAMLQVSMLAAQVSLLPEHTISLEGVTLIRDCHKAGRWYYVPERPMLLERNPGNAENPRPAFQLVTYQSEKDSRLYEGGVLQFSVSLKLPEDTRKKIVRALKSKFKNSGEISLAPLPFHTAAATLYNQSGEMTATGTQSPGLAPAFITGALPFQLKLSKFDSDMFAALVNSQTGGVGVLVSLTFDGLLPPAGFKVSIDWDQTFKHLSSSKSTRVALGGYLCGIDIGINKSKIREELVSAGCMKVETLTSAAVSNETLEKYLDPVLVQMQKKLVEKIHSPDKIDVTNSAGADSMNKCFLFARSSVDVTVKDIRQTRLGSETFEFNQSLIVPRKTVCGTFIGINKYPEALKKTLVRTMPLDSWASAFLLLPGIEECQEMQITAVSMTANVVDAKGKPVSTLSDTAQWSQEGGVWKNRDGEEVASLKFPLLSLFHEHGNKIEQIRREYSFKVDVIIDQQLGSRLNTVQTSYFAPMFDGDLPLPPAVDLVDCIIFDFSALTFDTRGLKKVRIAVTEGDKNQKLEYTLTQKNSSEYAVIMLVEAARSEEKTEQILPVILFEAGSKRNIPWKNNNKDLRSLDPSLYFMLFDSDWMQDS